jgi:integrase
MSAAGRLRPAIRAAAWQALIGLLAVTGMRPGEACRLGRGDVDLDTARIVIEESKFGKSRLVFLDPTAVTALRAYARARDAAFPEATTFLDLRHVFAVATLLDWYRDGRNVQARLPVLSTWPGHVDPKSTYWYLQAVPELLALAAGRLEPTGEEAAR